VLYVVCYDISEDRLRDRVSNALLDYGTRIQESVFECSLDVSDFRRMLQHLSLIPIEETDKVRIYRLCSPCVEAMQIYGPGELTRDPDFFLL